jgi:hypothetical protein
MKFGRLYVRIDRLERSVGALNRWSAVNRNHVHYPDVQGMLFNIDCRIYTLRAINAQSIAARHLSSRTR